MTTPTVVSGLFGQLNIPTSQSIAANALTNDRSGRPEVWRPEIIRTAPNGTCPLLALTGTMPSEQLKDPVFHWWTKGFGEQRVDITAGSLYSDALSTAYTGGAGVVGTSVYVKMSAANAANFTMENMVLFLDPTDGTNDVTGRVTAVPTINGASSYIIVELFTADSRSLRPTPRTLTDARSIQIIGTAHPQGGPRPVAKAYTATYETNYTQIFKNALDLTRTGAKTQTRTGDPYQDAKMDALSDHTTDLERAFIFGPQGMKQNSTNNQPQTTTKGLINFIRGYNSGSNVAGFDYDTTDEYAAQLWTAKGWKWIQDQMELITRVKGPANTNDRLVYCGRKALQAIQACIDEKSNTRVVVTPNTLEYGLNVRTLTSAFGSWHLQLHPLFDVAPWTNAMLAFVPKNLKYNYIDDTRFMSQANAKDFNTPDGYDKVNEHFITEAGLEVHVPEQMGLFFGVGIDNEEALP